MKDVHLCPKYATCPFLSSRLYWCIVHIKVSKWSLSWSLSKNYRIKPIGKTIPYYWNILHYSTYIVSCLTDRGVIWTILKIWMYERHESVMKSHRIHHPTTMTVLLWVSSQARLHPDLQRDVHVTVQPIQSPPPKSVGTNLQTKDYIKLLKIHNHIPSRQL